MSHPFKGDDCWDHDIVEIFSEVTEIWNIEFYRFLDIQSKMKDIKLNLA